MEVSAVPIHFTFGKFTCYAVFESNEASENSGQVTDDRGQDPDHAEGAAEAEPASGDAGRRNEREDDLKLK